jgi:hypothetical protein
MKTRLTTLRRIATRLDFEVYPQGANWVLSSRETEQLHYSVRTMRDALLVGLNRANDRGMLTEEESAAVRAA